MSGGVTEKDSPAFHPLLPKLRLWTRLGFPVLSREMVLLVMLPFEIIYIKELIDLNFSCTALAVSAASPDGHNVLFSAVLVFGVAFLNILYYIK